MTRLKAENERQKGQTDKYKDKVGARQWCLPTVRCRRQLSQIKASAKAKRDAKMANGETTRSSSSRRIAEDI